MKAVVLLALANLIFLVSGAQTKKYQSLLWEISGNGLSKKSYLYGTMHVSDRISFHLSDAFFEHLLNSDIVATEVDYVDWVKYDNILEMPDNYYYGGGSRGFYRSFHRLPVSKDNLISMFYHRNRMVNSMMFRTDNRKIDYQEDTYLDMFIFQTGRKYGKQTTGLENLKESWALISCLYQDRYHQPDEQSMIQIRKILKGREFYEAVSDFYREKDLDMIDSLYSLSNSEFYRDIMLYRRNQIMVNSMDSLMKTGSLFAGVGAAHLPGENGIIELLRNMGYVVTPVISEYTDQGRQQKRSIDNLLAKPVMMEYVSTDNMISLQMFDQVLHTKRNIQSLDLANGGFVSIKRLPLLNFLSKDGATVSHLTLDSLFFEHIPGEIISKEFVQVDEIYSYYDIKNITKTGNTQRYRFYFTPLEVIAVCMIGNGDYTRIHEDNVFSSIELKQAKSDWEIFTHHKNTFEVEVPSYYCAYGVIPAEPKNSNIELYAMDLSNNSAYFIIENSIEDHQWIEYEYELKRIQEEFYIFFDAEQQGDVLIENKRCLSEAVFGDKTMALQTIINVNTYYLMGCVMCDEEQQQRFFSSFCFTDESQPENYITYTDFELGFSIDLPFEQNEVHFLLNFDKPKPPIKKDENLLRSQRKNFVFHSSANDYVELKTFKYHPYKKISSVDSVFIEIRKLYLDEEPNWLDFLIDEDFDLNVFLENLYSNDRISKSTLGNMPYFSSKKIGPVTSSWNQLLNIGEKKKTLLVDESRRWHSNGDYYTYDFIVNQEGFNQALKVRVFFKDGYRFILEAPVCAGYQNDNGFIETLFETFQPGNKQPENSVFDNKIDLFLSHVESDDEQMQKSALNSFHWISIEEITREQLETLLELMNRHQGETDFIDEIIEKVAQLDNSFSFQILREIYEKENLHNSLRFSILEELASLKTEESYELIRNLMQFEIPLTNDTYQIDRFFSVLEKAPQLSNHMFPWLFDYLIIDEYKQPVLNYFRRTQENMENHIVLDDPIIHTLTTMANLEYMRVRSWKNNKIANKESFLSLYVAPSVRQLNSFLHILFPYYDKEQISCWWEKAEQLEVGLILTEMLLIKLHKNIEDNLLIEKLLNSKETMFITRIMLRNMLPEYELLPIAQEELAKTAAIALYQIDEEKFDFEFFTHKDKFEKGKTIRYFFFKSKKHDLQSWEREQTMLLCVGFILDEHMMIIEDAFYCATQKRIFNDDFIQDYMEEIIDRSLNEHIIRSSFTKNRKEGFYY